MIFECMLISGYGKIITSKSKPSVLSYILKTNILLFRNINIENKKWSSWSVTWLGVSTRLQAQSWKNKTWKIIWAFQPKIILAFHLLVSVVEFEFWKKILSITSYTWVEFLLYEPLLGEGLMSLWTKFLETYRFDW